MSKSLAVVLVLALFAPATAQAQEQDPLVGSTRMLYEIVKDYITRAADQMPAADYTYRPTPEVRSFGELIGHIADAHYMFCASALGETSPSMDELEKTKTTKAELVTALRGSFEYCDRAYRTLSDAQATQVTQLFGAQRTRLFALSINIAHDNEHYGNIVTYMRMKGMVPPSSQRAGM